VRMANSEWGKFTDFGVTLEDASGVQLGQGPLNYAFGRLEADLPVKFTGTTAGLRLYPAWARPGSTERWATSIQIRLYADPATELALAAKGSAAVTIPAGTPEAVGFTNAAAPWTLPQGFIPLIRYAATVAEGEPWTVEAPLAAAPTPLMR